MEFREFDVKDVKKLNEFLSVEGEFSCENAFVNLWAWQQLYNNRYAIFDDMLFVKSGAGDNCFFSLPFGGDLARGVEAVRRYSGEEAPVFWVQQSERFDEFCRIFGDEFRIVESRVDADYIYSRQALSELSGKKYHSKRNHISAFSRQFDWHYETLNERNVDKVMECAEKWYAENTERFSEEMECERRAVREMLTEREYLNLTGGVILVGDEAVSFCLGSPLNSTIFDIHIEKALSAYAGAYAVINREFARNELSQYTYINREDDLGIEGLRKAKLSYHPEFLLKKYVCYPRENV